MDAVSEKVLTEAMRVAGGNIEKARAWYFNEPLREFYGQTAASVVALGREADILLLLEAFEDGYLG